ncbi:MAG: polymerase subunit delta [Planctomycetota bacterium]
MRVEPLRGHEGRLAGLWRAAAEGRLAHALLFAGPAGIGKHLAAETLAAGLLCDRGPGEPCRTCGACKRCASGAHPDLHVVDPVAEELETIPIKRIARREDSQGQTVEEFLGLRAMEGGWRIVLLRESERLNEEAQNALLKTLEEPGDDALLVLECSRAERLLPTIASRVVRVAFQPLAVDEVARWLGQEGVESRVALDLARLSAGAIGVARRAQAEGWLERRAILCACLAGRLDAFAATAALVEVGGELQGKTAAAKARNAARATIDLGIALVRDLERLDAGVEAARLPHGGALLEAGLGLAGPAPRERLEQALAARQDVDLNLAPDAALERMLLAFAPARIERARKA